jgi:eukaryotic-like serine/threonine-protein kinase
VDPRASATTADPETTDGHVVAGDDMLAIGQRVGRYIILSHLGSGGMGMVYAAYDPELDRKIALKLVRPRVVGRDEARSRFVREARAMAKVAHPGVVPVHDVGAFGDSIFLAMELVDGCDAREWLDRERPTWRRALLALISAGRGLAAAHDAGIVHRDVKPANVLIGRDGRARVGDFGLARTDERESTSLVTTTGPGSSGEAEPATVTRSGVVLGTPAYMAPEQHLGRRADARSDQFSFCVLLYEAVYGERPFAAPPRSDVPVAVALAAEVSAGRIRPAPRTGRVPAWLRRALVRGLEVSPERRWPSMSALLAELDEAPRRRRRPLIAVGGTAALVTVGAAFALGRAAPADEPGSCTGGDALVASAWSPARRSAALARLEALGPYGQSASERIGAAVEGFATGWSGAHRDACLAHRRGDRSDALFDRQVACLERARTAFSALGEVVDSTEEATLPGAVVAASSLPELATCDDAEALLVAVAPPAATVAAAVARVASDVEHARVLVDAGRYDEAEALAERAVATARPLGYAPVLAGALAVEGRAAMNVTRGRARAVPLLDEAAGLAAEAGDDALAVETWARSAWARGTGATPSTDVTEGRQLALGLAARPTTARFARALLLNNLGSIADARGRRDEARIWFAQAVATAAEVSGPGAIELVNASGNLARVTDDAERRDALFADATARLERLVGSDHPETLRMRASRGIFQPVLPRAAELLAPTCERWDVFPAAFAMHAVSCWSELAFIAEELGDRDRAVMAASRASIGERGSDALEARGYLPLWKGDAAAARALFASALDGVPVTPHEAWWTRYLRAKLELGLARAELAGDGRDGRVHLEAAIADLSAVAEQHPTAAVARRLARARAELERLGGR